MIARGAFRPGPAPVIRRELRRAFRRPVLLVPILLMPLLTMAVLSGLFSWGQATRLPIGALDVDGSELSRTVTRMVDIAPEVSIRPVSDMGEGRRLIISGDIIGLLMIPQDFQRDVLRGRRPETVFFYSTQMMTVGNLALRGVSAAVTTAVAGVRVSSRTARGQTNDEARAAITPIPVDTHPLFNPTLNYVYFLLATVLPIILQLAIVTVTAYSVGVDMENPARTRALARLGGGMGTVLFAKALPYTFLFLFLLGLSDVVVFGLLGTPLNGDLITLVVTAVAFVVAAQLFGIVLGLWMRPAVNAISVASFVMAPAYSFVGITYPFMGMNTVSRVWGAIFPGTWYLEARVDQTIRDAPPEVAFQPFLVLCGMAVILALLAVLGARRVTAVGRRDGR